MVEGPADARFPVAADGILAGFLVAGFFVASPVFASLAWSGHGVLPHRYTDAH
jgi:hypothetical protein